MNTKLKFSLIAVDSPRLRSYIYFFEKNNLEFEKIFFLKKNSISEKFKFLNNSYFDNTDYSFQKFFKKNKKKIIKCNFSSANNLSLIKKIKDCESQYIIFCSNPGDILKRDFFKINKKIIHVHPGELTKFRGSTPYYYQLIKKKSITFTSFFMNPKLDTGDYIYSETIKLNNINKIDLNFLDEIYDPYLRGKVLIKTIHKISNKRQPITKKILKSKDSPYFIIHPVIKYISINKNIQKLI